MKYNRFTTHIAVIIMSISLTRGDERRFIWVILHMAKGELGQIFTASCANTQRRSQPNSGAGRNNTSFPHYKSQHHFWIIFWVICNILPRNIQGREGNILPFTFISENVNYFGDGRNRAWAEPDTGQNKGSEIETVIWFKSSYSGLQQQTSFSCPRLRSFLSKISAY